jgi:hypothetical protein
MGTKKGQVRKTARRAYKPKKKSRTINPSKMTMNEILKEFNTSWNKIIKEDKRKTSLYRRKK